MHTGQKLKSEGVEFGVVIPETEHEELLVELLVRNALSSLGSSKNSEDARFGLRITDDVVLQLTPFLDEDSRGSGVYSVTLYGSGEFKVTMRACLIANVDEFFVALVDGEDRVSYVLPQFIAWNLETREFLAKQGIKLGGYFIDEC